jgi:hypothetical protein
LRFVYRNELILARREGSESLAPSQPPLLRRFDLNLADFHVFQLSMHARRNSLQASISSWEYPSASALAS